MNIALSPQYRRPFTGEELELAELRALAMRPSLGAVGRYDELRVRQRLLSDYHPDRIWVILMEGRVAGFYGIERGEGRVDLVHLYIDPSAQGHGLGRLVMERIKSESAGSVICLKALKGSPANGFYLSQGFRLTGEEEWDNLYELVPSDC